MAIKKVWLDESEDTCIACGMCENICPEVFVVNDKMEVKLVANLSEFEAEINTAVDTCPTAVIKTEEN